MMDLADSLAGEAAPSQSQRINAVSVCVACGRRLRKRQDVFSDGCAAANEGICADADEMMDRAERAYLGPVTDYDVTTEGCGIGQQDVITDEAIVRDVSVSHDEGVIADTREATAFYGATVDGYELADFIVITNFQARRFASIA